MQQNLPEWMNFPKEIQVLNLDGEVSLIPEFIGTKDADNLMSELVDQCQWQQPQIKLFGKSVLSPRLAAWYGDPGAHYRYSGLDNSPMLWLPALAELRELLAHHCGHRFNSVLCNYYRDGDDAMGWHADDEAALGKSPIIGSLSFGAERRFLLKHKQRRDIATIKLDLGHGDLLLMQGATQHNWRHRISRTRVPVGPRINLTFRQVIK